MLEKKSIIYSNELNKALWVKDLTNPFRYDVYGTDSNKETDLKFTKILKISEVDQETKNNTKFYKINTKSGFSIILPDNTNTFIQVKGKKGKEEVLYYNISLLKEALDNNEQIIFKLAQPSFFSEIKIEPEELAKLDRIGAILAMFFSSYSKCKINNPELHFLRNKQNIVNRLFSLSKEFEIDKLVLQIFGNDPFTDLKEYVTEVDNKTYNFIGETKHTEVYKEALNMVLGSFLDESYYDKNIGFNNELVKDAVYDDTIVHVLQTKLSPRTIFTFLFYLFKIESALTGKENELIVPNEYAARTIQDLAFIGNLLTIYHKNENKLEIDLQALQSKVPVPTYTQLESLEEITDISNLDFLNIKSASDKLVVNGFIILLDN